MSLLISGYAGFGNEGDELILQALLAGLGPLAQDARVLSGRPRETAARHGVRTWNRWNPATVFAAAARCRALLAGGGGLIQDLSGAWSPAYYLGVLSLARLLGKPVYWVGQGFGPLARERYGPWVRRELEYAGLVVTRDRQGMDWCRKRGASADRVHAGADLVWLLPDPPRRPGTDWAICLRGDRVPEAVPAWLQAVAGQILGQGKRLRFIALDRVRDARAAQAATDQFPGSRSVVPGPAGLPEDAFSGVEMVISQRYHGIILGVKSGAAATGLGEDPKIHYLLKELGLPMFSETTLPAKISELTQNGPMLAARAAVNAARLQDLAQSGMQMVLAELSA